MLHQLFVLWPDIFVAIMAAALCTLRLNHVRCGSLGFFVCISEFCFIILLLTHTPAFGNCSQMCGTHYNHKDCYVSCICNKDSPTHLQHVLCCSMGQRFSWRVNWCTWAMLVIFRKEALRKVQFVLCSDISHYVVKPATETCHLNIHISRH